MSALRCGACVGCVMRADVERAVMEQDAITAVQDEAIRAEALAASGAATWDGFQLLAPSAIARVTFAFRSRFAELAEDHQRRVASIVAAAKDAGMLIGCTAALSHVRVIDNVDGRLVSVVKPALVVSRDFADAHGGYYARNLADAYRPEENA